MSWLIFIAHGFNPFLLLLGVSNLKNNQNETPVYNVETALSLVFASLFIYVFWLGLHYLVLKLKGSEFSLQAFIGVDKGFVYFLPFLLGALMLLNEFVLRQLLQGENTEVLCNIITSTLFVLGCYFMFVNYLAWLAE